MSRAFPRSAVEVAIQVGLRQAQTVRITRQLPSQDSTAGQAEDRLYDLKSIEMKQQFFNTCWHLDCEIGSSIAAAVLEALLQVHQVSALLQFVADH